MGRPTVLGRHKCEEVMPWTWLNWPAAWDRQSGMVCDTWLTGYWAPVKAATKPVRRVSGGGRASIKRDTILKCFPFSQDNGFCFLFFWLKYVINLGLLTHFANNGPAVSPLASQWRKWTFPEGRQNTSLRTEYSPLDGPTQTFMRSNHGEIVLQYSIAILQHYRMWPTAIIARLTNCVC